MQVELLKKVISLEDGNIKAVDEFQYLGSLIATTGKMDWHKLQKLLVN